MGGPTQADDGEHGIINVIVIEVTAVGRQMSLRAGEWSTPMSCKTPHILGPSRVRVSL